METILAQGKQSMQIVNHDYTVDELAKVCRVGPNTVRRWIASGKVAAIRLPGGFYRIPADEVRRLRTLTGLGTRGV